MKNIIVPFILCALLSSCGFEVEKEIDTNFKVGDSKLVVNSIFSNEGPVICKVYRSQPPLGENFDSLLSTATVMLYEDGVYKETLVFNGLQHQSSLVPQVGKSYKVVAKYPGLPEVYSNSYIPLQIPFAAYSFIEDAGVNSNGQPQSSFTFTIPDPAAENYYKLEFYRLGMGGDYYQGYYSSEDPILKNDDGFLDEEASTRETFNDNLFNGTSRTITITFNKDMDPTTDPRYKFRLQHLSKEAYNYLSKMDIEYYSYPDPFMEPVFIYSNIENGYGIFGGKSSVEVVVQ